MAIVYKHIRKDTNEVFYVGMGKTKKRAYSKWGRNRYWKNIVNKHGYEVVIISDNLTTEDALEMEMELIQEYGRTDLGTGKLVNMTDGGDGGVAGGQNNPSNEFRDRMREVRYEYLANLTDEQLKEYKKNISLANKKRWEWYVPSDEARRKMSEAAKKTSKQQRKKGIPRNISEETREKYREHAKVLSADPEIRKKISNATKDMWDNTDTTERRRKMSEAKKEWWRKKKSGEV